MGFRNGDYKYVFSEQRKEGTMGLWAESFTTLRLQKIFNLMQDPFERADFTSNIFWDWRASTHIGAVYGAMDDVFQFVATFKDFPPRSFPPSFNPANSSGLQKSADGSVDVFFDPKVPAGKESNWVPTNASRKIRSAVPHLWPREAVLRQDVGAAGHREIEG